MHFNLTKMQDQKNEKNLSSDVGICDILIAQYAEIGGLLNEGVNVRRGMSERREIFPVVSYCHR